MTAKDQLLLAGRLEALMAVVPLIKKSRTAQDLETTVMAMVHDAEKKLAAVTVMTAEHKRYLDELLRSGVTNMFGAAPYLRNAFPALTNEQAKKILGEWMRTFKEEDR